MALYVRKITYAAGSRKGMFWLEDRAENVPEHEGIKPEECYQNFKSAAIGCAALEHYYKRRYNDCEKANGKECADDMFAMTVRPQLVDFVDGKMVVA